MDHFLNDASFMKLFLHPYSAMIITPLWLRPFANVSILLLTPCILSLERFPSLFGSCIILLDYLSLDLFMMRYYRARKSYLMMQRSPHSHQVFETYSLQSSNLLWDERKVFSQVSLLGVILVQKLHEVCKTPKEEYKE